MGNVATSGRSFNSGNMVLFVRCGSPVSDCQMFVDSFAISISAFSRVSFSTVVAPYVLAGMVKASADTEQLSSGSIVLSLHATGTLS